MISSIHIRNLGILESVEVNFQNGFHAISGETGAGKSVFFQAMAFVLGARADADWIRTGAEEASVTLQLDVKGQKDWKKNLEDLGIPVEAGESEVQLRRTLSTAGRSKAYLNDVPVTLKTLQAFGESCIHIVGQHAAHRLFENTYLLSLLDRFAENAELKQGYAAALAVYRSNERELKALQENARQNREQEDFLRFQFEELDKAKLLEGEEENLESGKNRLKHQVALAELAFQMSQGIQDSEVSASDQLGKVLHLARKAQGFDPAFEALCQTLHQALSQTDEASRWVEHYRSKLNDEPEALDGIEARLSLLADLKRKYRGEVSDLIAKREQLEKQVGDLENFDERLKTLHSALAEQALKVNAAAEKLRRQRQKAALRLGTQVEKALKDLALPHAALQISLQALKDVATFREDGADDLSVLISFNPGEEKRPLEEVASGGELSRLLLALYEILFPPEEFLALVFDEVDAGVGGRIAELIGRKLESLSKKTQVFCVTHLAQIACHAEWHFVVEKEVRRQRTYSQIKCLSVAEREREVARMLAGVEITDQALKHAREMLRNAAA